MRYVSPVIITASVSDDHGEHWVSFVRSLGWSCDCGENGRCAHVLATQQTVER